MSDRVGKITFDADVDASDIGDEIRRAVQEQVLPELRDIEKEAMHVQAAIKEGFQPGDVDKFRKAVGLAGDETEGAARAAADFKRELGDVRYKTVSEAAVAAREVRDELAEAAREALKLDAALEEDAIAARHAAAATRDLDKSVSDLEASNGRVSKATAESERRSLALAKAQDAERAKLEKLIDVQKRYDDELAKQPKRLNGKFSSSADAIPDPVDQGLQDELHKAQTVYTDALAARESAYRTYTQSVANIGHAEVANIEEVTRARERSGEAASKAEIEASRSRRAQISADTKAALDADKLELNSALNVYKERQRLRTSTPISRGFPSLAGGDDDGTAELRKAANSQVASTRSVAGQLDFLSARFAALGSIIVVAAIPAIGLAAGAIGQLGVAFASLGPAAIAGIATLKLGFDGLTEGAKAFNKQFDDVDKARFEKIGQEMGPMLTSFHDLQAAVQSSFADRLQPTFANIANLIDQLGPHLVHITDAFADGANALTDGLHLVQGPLNNIIESSAEFIRVMAPFGNQLMLVFGQVGDAAAKYIPRIATAFGSVVTQIDSAITNSLNGGDFDKIMASFSPTIEAMGRLIGSLITNLNDLGAAVGPTLGPLLDGISAFFNNLMPSMTQTGVTLSKVLAEILPQLGSALNTLGPAIDALIPSLGVVITIFGQVLTAAAPLITALSTGFKTALDGLNVGLQPVIPLIASLASQFAPLLLQMGQQLASVFIQLSPAIVDTIVQLTPLVAKLIPDISKAIAAFAQAVIAIGPGVLLGILAIVKPLGAVADMLAHIPGLVTLVATAFVAWKGITMVAALATAVKDLGIALAAIPNRVVNIGQAFAGGGGGPVGGKYGPGGGSGGPGKGGGGGTRALGVGSMGTLGALLLAGSQFGTQSDSGLGQTAGVLGSVGGGALLGAEVGSIFPGPGTAVGAGIGAALGLVAGGYSLIAENADKAKAASDTSLQGMAQRALEVKAALDAAADAQHNLNSAAALSGGKIDDNVLGQVQQNLADLPNQIKGRDGTAAVDAYNDAISKLHISTKELASEIAGDQGIFNALVANLQSQGPAGQAAASQMTSLRDELFGATQRATEMSPALQNLAKALHVDAGQAFTDLVQTVNAIPKNVPINVNVKGQEAAATILTGLGAQIRTDTDGTIHFTAPIPPEVTAALESLGIKIKENTKGDIEFTINQPSYDAALERLKALGNPIFVPMNVVPSAGGNPGETGPPVDVPTVPPPGWKPGDPIPGQPRASGGLVRGFANGGVFDGNVNVDPNGDYPWVPNDQGTEPNIPPWWNNGDGKIPIDNAWMPNAGGIPPGLWWHYPDLLPGGGWAPKHSYIGGPRADGGSTGFSGVLPGYSPGHDNLMVPESGGEGVIIPEAMKALGPDWLYRLNSHFRPGISRAGYASGGTVGGFADGGVNDDVLPADKPVIDLLTQIRDLLSGRVGAGPLTETAKSTSTMAQGLAQGIQSGGIGPFGTPKKAPSAYGTAAAVIKALGGDPEMIIGEDPAKYFGQGGQGGAGAPGGFAGAAPDYGKYAAALSSLAHSGSLGDVSGIGLGADDPTVRAIITARNRKKGGLDDDTIAGLINQVITGGGYTGTLDGSNSSLVESLTEFRKKLGKGTAPALPGGAPASPYDAPVLGPAAFGGVAGPTPGGPGSAQALISFAQAANGGTYAPASDLAHGLADCSGAVSDLVELLTKGTTSPARLFDTHNEQAVLQSLGATPGFVPGSLNIGFNDAHTAATLPNGAPFESGGPSGGGVTYGVGQGALQPQFKGNVWSLPTDMTGRAGAGAGPQFSGSTPGLSGFGGQVVPVYVTNWGGQGQQGGGLTALTGIGNQAAAAGLTAGGQATAQVAGDVIDALGSTQLGNATPAAAIAAAHPVPAASLESLVAQRNPLAIATAAGFNVPNFARDGGAIPDDQFAAEGPSHQADGRMFSNTEALSQRTFTDLHVQLQAMTKQLTTVMGQVKTQLDDKALKPIMQGAVTSGFEGVKDSTFNDMGTTIGQTAAPPIAGAVKDAVASLPTQPSPSATTADLQAQQGANVLFDEGGLWATGTTGVNLSGHFERVLNPSETQAYDAGLLGGWNLQPQEQHYAASKDVVSNSYLGAQAFGVDQIPIIGAIVNLLVSVLLQVLGVQIKERDTLLDMSTDFKSFRGDAFKAFDAQGRLMNDTSGLTDRSSSSEAEAADERIRILKIVLQALIKYIIENVIVPIAKAVAQTAVSAGASAAGSAVSAGIDSGGGVAGSLVGGVVTSAINSAGTAAIDITAQIATDIAEALVQVLLDMFFEGLQSYLPGLTNTLFGGGLAEKIAGPIGNALSGHIGGVVQQSTSSGVGQALQQQFLGRGIGSILTGGASGGLLGILISLLSAFTGTGGLFKGGAFDDGGIATGIGFMPKATLAPERVLSPGQTESFDRFIDALSNGAGGSRSTVIHAPFTVLGNAQAGEKAHGQLMKLMG